MAEPATQRYQALYDTVVGALGVGEASRNVADSGHIRLIYTGEDGTAFSVIQPINNEPATVSNSSTVAFQCNSLEQLKQFHDAAVAAGGTLIEAPLVLAIRPLWARSNSPMSATRMATSFAASTSSND